MDSVHIYIIIIAFMIYLVYSNYHLIDFVLKTNLPKCYNNEKCKKYLDKYFKYD